MPDHNQYVRVTTIAHPPKQDGYSGVQSETTKAMQQREKSRSTFKVPDVNSFTGLLSSISEGTMRNVRPFAVRFPRTTSGCMSSNTLCSIAALVCSGYQQSCWSGVSNPAKSICIGKWQGVVEGVPGVPGLSGTKGTPGTSETPAIKGIPGIKGKPGTRRQPGSLSVKFFSLTEKQEWKRVEKCGISFPYIFWERGRSLMLT